MAKQNIFKKQLPLILVAATGILLATIYFVYRGITRNKCDSVFEQTADRVGGSLEVIKIKGSLVLGQEKVQELTEGSQKVALHLKTCCIAQQGGNMNGEQFQSCISGAKDYETRIAQVATSINEAQAAEQQGNTQLAQQKTEQARQSASAATTTEKSLGEMTKTLSAAVPVKAGAEQEANDTILQANTAEMGTNIAGAIAPGDVDFFQFQYRDGKNRRDIVTVHLENKSATYQPMMALYKEDKSLFQDWNGPSAGANQDLWFTAEPGKKYFVAVGSRYGSSGQYILSVSPQKAYDQYEPNDDAFTATAIKFGQSVEANIMDGNDPDFYRLSGVGGNTVNVRLENQSNTLRPMIRILNADKSVAREWVTTNAEGAELAFSFSVTPGQDYFVELGGQYGSMGKYRLSTH
ncbi:MAG: hypothetical protein DMF70_06540 [Acidobacteria bacterium]|nr:MAG: hypothetical protein DMF70_06540 [Acidobacteriota bacterium]